MHQEDDAGSKEEHAPGKRKPVAGADVGDSVERCATDKEDPSDSGQEGGYSHYRVRSVGLINIAVYLPGTGRVRRRGHQRHQQKWQCALSHDTLLFLFPKGDEYRPPSQRWRSPTLPRCNLTDFRDWGTTPQRINVQRDVNIGSGRTSYGQEAQLGGFYLIEATDLDAAIAMVRDLPLG